MQKQMAEKHVRKSNPVKDLLSIFKDDMDQVNALIMQEMRSDVALIPQLAGYLIASGGKRLRPLLTIISSALFGYRGIRAQRLAACVEFIHTATLLHDDVVDESDKRRGQDTANLIFGNQASVLVGDFLFSRAFQLMVADGDLEILRILSDASAVIAEGEVLQLATTSNLQTTFDEYKDVIESKTAALFAAATEVGAVINKQDPMVQSEVKNYGMALGVAFQIVDDVLDYAPPSQDLGKDTGDDFKEGKMTLPVILSYQDADEEERAFWKRVFVDDDQKESDFEAAQAYIKASNAIERSLDVARSYADQAEGNMQKLIDQNCVSDSNLANTLIDLVHYSINRHY